MKTLTKLILCIIFLVVVLCFPAYSGSKKVSAASKPKKVEFVDYLLDYDALHGQVVQLDGFLLTMGEMYILYERPGSGNFVFIDVSKLSRNDRKFILTRCGNGCPMSIVGKPGDVIFNKGLAAIRIAR
ncbi:MAG: hypothetical protein GTN76_13070 [Candidatus Aenigmarchaeota archaeon]|nr:hypothetical protein [Candidatus Aenigmarchaeota archaeon]